MTQAVCSGISATTPPVAAMTRLRGFAHLQIDRPVIRRGKSAFLRQGARRRVAPCHDEQEQVQYEQKLPFALDQETAPRAARDSRSTDLRRIGRSRLIKADVTEPFSSCAGHRHETADEREVLLTFRVSRIRHRWTIGTWFLRHLYFGSISYMWVGSLSRRRARVVPLRLRGRERERLRSCSYRVSSEGWRDALVSPKRRGAFSADGNRRSVTPPGPTREARTLEGRGRSQWSARPPHVARRAACQGP